MPSRSSSKRRLTQSELIKHFSEKTGLKPSQVKELFEQISSLAAREVQANGEFILPGFGKLVKTERKAREGRNPATGQIIQIPAKTTLKFRVGKTMRSSLGGDSPTPSD